jgi:CelD/BcsL family acetyltransferase involved in cellulose biosynthesis
MADDARAANWTVHPVAHFASVARTWDALCARSGALPFLRSDFLLPALAEFGAGGEVLAIAGSPAEPVAMGLFVRKRAGTWETFQPAQLPLGALVAGNTPDVATLGRSLMPALPGFALTVAITQQDPAIRARPDDASSLGTLDYVDTARVPVEGTFDAYWAARGKNLRQNVRKQLTKVEQDGTVPRLDCVTEPQGVAGAIEQYGRLESAGWKAQGGTAIGAGNAQGLFYRSVFEAFCARGAGRIYRYWFGDRVVAMDLCVLDGPVLVVLKTTYDETLRSVSPASLLRYAYFRALFDEGVIRSIEFYGKVMDWHLRWTSDVRTLYHVNAYRWPWVKRLHARRRTRQREEKNTEPASLADPPGGATSSENRV